MDLTKMTMEELLKLWRQQKMMLEQASSNLKFLDVELARREQAPAVDPNGKIEVPA